jgi:Phospholipase_D-nuclease N-terminal/zinc-ribbon domain
MMTQRFLSVVPKPVRTSAFILVVCGSFIGLIVGFLWPSIQYRQHFDTATAILAGVACLAAGVFLSCLIATWLLCLGYVYGDARRRAMQPVLWVLVAIFVPHLLGFLLYFVLRQPISSTCPHCGQTISLYQRFCPWCGKPHTPQPPSASSDVRPAMS